MKSEAFIAKAIEIATKHKTIYMWGTFGAPVTENLIVQKSKQYPSYYSLQKLRTYRALVGRGVFGFDCIGLIKGILWGWYGDSSKNYGGAKFTAHEIPDINANMAIDMCKEVSLDFKTIIPGEVVWMPGHIGIYIGDGKVVEATPSWTDGVQITACLNVGKIQNLNGRTWQKHGKLPWVEYQMDEVEEIVERLIELKVVTNREYWISALNGNRIADASSLKKAFTNAIKAIE